MTLNIALEYLLFSIIIYLLCIIRLFVTREGNFAIETEKKMKRNLLSL